MEAGGGVLDPGGICSGVGGQSSISILELELSLSLLGSGSMPATFSLLILTNNIYLEISISVIIDFFLKISPNKLSVVEAANKAIFDQINPSVERQDTMSPVVQSSSSQNYFPLSSSS